MYKKEDFNKCLYNPLSKQDWYDIEDKRKLQYISALYDPNSPLIREEPNLNIRKQKAANVAGFDYGEKELLEDMYTFNDEAFLNAVDKYLKKVQDKKWAMIVSLEQTWWEWNQRMLKPVSSDKGDKDELQAIEIKARVRDEMMKTEKMVNDLYLQFYHGDEELNNKAQRKRTTIENILG